MVAGGIPVFRRVNVPDRGPNTAAECWGEVLTLTLRAMSDSTPSPTRGHDDVRQGTRGD